MNTKQNTMKEIKDYLHLYLGCRCEVETYMATCDWGMNRVEKLTAQILAGVHGKRNKVIKLFLRQLSSMTEEEIYDLINSMCPDDIEDIPEKDEYDFEMFYNDGGNMVDSDVAVGSDYSCRCYEGQISITHDGTIHCFDEKGEKEIMVNVPRAYHYLLSKHFDLFGLIDAGLAIDITKQVVN